ncbi:MAG TPA: hypothetical protein DHW02_14835, partial [Ktedonobacter sp.]|nr:hypothetical protein [Ktedonobacter sp.]
MAVDEINQRQRIKNILQDAEVQFRVQENIRRGQEDVKVTIGRASELFHLKASKLRELDDLLMPGRGRSKDTGGGQRQYSLAELNKLAIISELLNHEKIPVGEIPPDIDEIWDSVSLSSEALHEASESSNNKVHVEPTIDQRVERANEEAFWRYFTAQALKLSLNLICEDIPDVVAGIILPLNRKTNASSTLNPEYIDQLGECLIGWRDQHGSFVTFYTPAPHFDFHTDFRIRGLRAEEETEPQDKTFVVLERNAMQLHLSIPVVEAIRRLLAPIYEDAHEKKAYYERGMKDATYPAIPSVGTTVPDTMLTEFANMAVRLGGKTGSGKDRWKFCVLLMPNNPLLSLQLRSLVVQAQSQRSPHDVGKTLVSPDTTFLSLSLRAFQGIRVLYRSQISEKDEAIAYRDKEGPIQSAIAIPIAKNDGLPIAVLYLVSEEQAAFDTEYQRVLRLVSLIIGELLEDSHALSQIEERVSDVVEQPQVVNKILGAFSSENNFMSDVAAILHDIKEKGYSSEEVAASFISIDVDDLSKQTNKYGDQVLVNLSKVLGNRLEGQIGLLFDKQKGCKLYHIFADRFYLLINGVSLEKVRESAE